MWGTWVLHKWKGLVLPVQVEYDPGLIHTDRKWSCMTHRGGPTDQNKPVRPDGSTVHSLSSETNETYPHCTTLQVIILRKPAHSPELWGTVRKKEEKLSNFMSGAHLLFSTDEMPHKAEIWNHNTRKYPLPNLIYSVINVGQRGKYMMSKKPLLALQSPVQLICSWRTSNSLSTLSLTGRPLCTRLLVIKINSVWRVLTKSVQDLAKSSYHNLATKTTKNSKIVH